MILNIFWICLFSFVSVSTAQLMVETPLLTNAETVANITAEFYPTKITVDGGRTITQCIPHIQLPLCYTTKVLRNTLHLEIYYTLLGYHKMVFTDTEGNPHEMIINFNNKYNEIPPEGEINTNYWGLLKTQKIILPYKVKSITVKAYDDKPGILTGINESFEEAGTYFWNFVRDSYTIIRAQPSENPFTVELSDDKGQFVKVLFKPKPVTNP